MKEPSLKKSKKSEVEVDMTAEALGEMLDDAGTETKQQKWEEAALGKKKFQRKKPFKKDFRKKRAGAKTAQRKK